MKPAIITLAGNENSYKCSSCIMYTVLFWIFSAINIGGKGAYFGCFYWYLKKDSPHVDFNTQKETTIYWTIYILCEKLNKLTLKIKVIIFTTIKLI